MVRIWVYPVLAFIVAFLPTLMVEIGFSTVFQPERKRPAYRLGFLGRRLHWLYIRAGHQKILRAERIAREANIGIATRDKALAEAKSVAYNSEVEKQTALEAAHETLSAGHAFHEAQLTRMEEEHTARLNNIQQDSSVKLAFMTDSLNRAVAEKNSLLSAQKSEIERQIQAREKVWSDSLSQMHQQLEDQRTASVAEPSAHMQESHIETPWTSRKMPKARSSRPAASRYD